MVAESARPAVHDGNRLRHKLSCRGRARRVEQQSRNMETYDVRAPYGPFNASIRSLCPCLSAVFVARLAPAGPDPSFPDPSLSPSPTPTPTLAQLLGFLLSLTFGRNLAVFLSSCCCAYHAVMGGPILRNLCSTDHGLLE